MLSLVLIGMRIQQLESWRHLPPALVAVSIKMLVLPLTVGFGLTLLGVEGATRLVLILQTGMPCAFSNLVLAEAYDLDRELSVTCVALSSGILLLTLPIWLWQFFRLRGCFTATGLQYGAAKTPQSLTFRSIFIGCWRCRLTPEPRGKAFKD